MEMTTCRAAQRPRKEFEFLAFLLQSTSARHCVFWNGFYVGNWVIPPHAGPRNSTSRIVQFHNLPVAILRAAQYNFWEFFGWKRY